MNFQINNLCFKFSSFSRIVRGSFAAVLFLTRVSWKKSQTAFTHGVIVKLSLLWCDDTMVIGFSSLRNRPPLKWKVLRFRRGSSTSVLFSLKWRSNALYRQLHCPALCFCFLPYWWWYLVRGPVFRNVLFAIIQIFSFQIILLLRLVLLQLSSSLTQYLLFVLTYTALFNIHRVLVSHT